MEERDRKASRKATLGGYKLAGDDICGIWGGPARRGLQAMSEEQLRVECTARGLQTGGRSSMHHSLLGAFAHFGQGQTGEQEMHVETGDTNAIVRSVGHQTTVPSSKGPVQIRAVINGVQAECFVSTTSTFTLFSTAFAKRAGIDSSGLTSTAFMCNMKPLGEARRLRGVRIRIGDVEVPIKTAISARVKRDVQLGMDFFAQAVHAEIDVFIASSPPQYVRLLPAHGSNCWVMESEPPPQAREELRFHAEGGGIAVMPLHHFKVQEGDAYSSTVHIDANTRLDTCSICGEYWPGMQKCEACWVEERNRVPFCSKSCARAHVLASPACKR